MGHWGGREPQQAPVVALSPVCQVVKPTLTLFLAPPHLLLLLHPLPLRPQRFPLLPPRLHSPPPWGTRRESNVRLAVPLLHHHHQWPGALGGPEGWGKEDGRSQRKDRTQLLRRGGMVGRSGHSPQPRPLSTSTTSFFRSFRLAFSSTFSFFSFRSCRRERGHLSLARNHLQL